MYGADQLLLAATAATIVVLFGMTYLQKKLRIYDLFASKKLALPAHYIIVALVFLELLIFTYFDIRSKWLFTTVLWPLGALVFAGSVVLLVSAIEESGIGALVASQVFTGKKPHHGPIWKRYKQPFALGFAGVYLGLALLSGHIAYLIVAAMMGISLWLFNYLTK